MLSKEGLQFVWIGPYIWAQNGPGTKCAGVVSPISNVFILVLINNYNLTIVWFVIKKKLFDFLHKGKEGLKKEKGKIKYLFHPKFEINIHFLYKVLAKWSLQMMYDN